MVIASLEDEPDDDDRLIRSDAISPITDSVCCRYHLSLESTMRILLVEDDRMIGAAVTQALKDAAYAVDWVMDGQTAIDAAEAEA